MNCVYFFLISIRVILRQRSLSGNHGRCLVLPDSVRQSRTEKHAITPSISFHRVRSTPGLAIQIIDSIIFFNHAFRAAAHFFSPMRDGTFLGTTQEKCLRYSGHMNSLFSMTGFFVLHILTCMSQGGQHVPGYTG